MKNNLESTEEVHALQPHQKSTTYALTYIIAFILVIGWVVGLFGFHAGNAIHLLLAMAMTAVSVNIIREG